MRKYILAAIALLVSSGAFAAFSIIQTYSGVVLPQITCNLVTGVASVAGPCTSGTTCNGNKITTTLTVTTGVFSSNLRVFSNTFNAGDVGKGIQIPASGTNNSISAVGTFSGGFQDITLNNNSTSTALTATATSVTYGSNDTPALMAFNTWALANQGSNQTVLTIPNGSNCWTGYGNANFAKGIKNLIVQGSGATLDSVNGAGFFLAGSGMCFQGLTASPGCDARIQTVSAGSSTLTLTAASYAAGYISRFSVGLPVMLGGLNSLADFQAPYGDPPDLTYFEWKKITAICNNTVGCVGSATITLDSPLTLSYSSAWPEFHQGDGFHSDAGGPATVWAMDPSWETTVEYQGLTISQSGQTYANGRNVTYRNVTFTGGNGPSPTQNETFSAINTNMAGVDMEVDKLIGTLLFDGVTIYKINHQSTSTRNLIVKNSTITGELEGGATVSTAVSDTTINLYSPGISAYGSTGTATSTTCTRCTITTLNFQLGYSDVGAGTSGIWTKSGGTITMPNAGAQGAGPGQRQFVPGSNLFYSTGSSNPPISFACCGSIGSFQVGAITSDPWPALDNQTQTTTVNITSGTSTLNVPSAPFVVGDVGKTIIVNGAGGSGGQLRTWIIGYTDASHVTLYNTAGTTVAASQTIQWGTSNTYIATNQSGGFPSNAAFSTNPLSLGFLTSGSWNFTCDICNAGQPNTDAYAVSLQAGATANKPLGSYINKQYTPTSAQGSLGTVYTRGVFQSLSINVTAAATAAGSVLLNAGGQFHWIMIDQNTPAAPAFFDWLAGDFVINLKQTGNRVIASNGTVTCNSSAGACAGDTINVPAHLSTMWMDFGMSPFMSSSFTTGPTFNITMTTNPIQ